MSGSAGLSPSRSRKPEGSTLNGYARNLRKECAGLVAGQAVLTAEIRTVDQLARRAMRSDSHRFLGICSGILTLASAIALLSGLCKQSALGSTALLAAQHVPAGPGLPIRRYREGEKLTYLMKAVNESWHYEIRADGVVKRAADGSYFEEYARSDLRSDGQKVTLSPTTMKFRQQLTLDPNHGVGLPNLSQIDPRLIGPVTDMLTFYVDVRLAAKSGKLTQAGDYAYVKFGTPVSWADGTHVLLGQSSIDFDFALKSIDRSKSAVTLVASHVPPETPEVKLPALWMQKPVADTPNNWVMVQKTGGGKYLAAVGKETFEDEIVLSLSDGKILSATMDNTVQTVERECSDAAASQCGDPKPHLIRRKIAISLERSNDIESKLDDSTHDYCPAAFLRLRFAKISM
jgi:hypothetical protein